MNNKHHGQLIEKIIRRNGHSITDVARLTNVNRRSVYNWFNKARLKPRTIKCIGEAIRYDFTGIFPEFKGDIAIEEFQLTETIKNKGLDNEAYDWKDKYIELLEKHAELLSHIGDKSIG
ncbi:MAG: XRE family transcriptional regulator [Flavobacterium sp.]|nr:MAG: XRE family transcriptional regulator [Flavobacterium sp.]